LSKVGEAAVRLRTPLESSSTSSFVGHKRTKETLIIGHPGRNQDATQEAWFLDGFIFTRLHA
jgi:hypothetical protein